MPSPAPARAARALCTSRPRRFRGRRWLAIALAIPAALIFGSNAWVLTESRGRLHAPTSAGLPAVPVALVLGTSARRPDGSPNQHFQQRMKAAAALHAAGKTRILLVSGASDGRYYNEPRDMRAALMALGVPDSAIVLDADGVRTLDSVQRLRDAYRVKRCAIVSDAWHVPRALFIADRLGLSSIGVPADPIPLRHSFKARSREWLARVLVVLDLYVLHTRPERPISGNEPDLSSVSPPG
ncbi:MAG: vancomycin high temperature exclusion protein [Verrucomicrobiales bacterium]